MTIPTLGNTPSGQAYTPDELGKDALVWMGQAADRGEEPVIFFYRTLEHGTPFAPDPRKLDPKTGQPRLVDPVTVDVFIPNGPLAGRVWRGVGFIGSGMTRPIRKTEVGSINVGQLGWGKNGDTVYPQLNSLDSDALAWATSVHEAAGGDVFAYYSGEPSAPVAAAQPAPTQPPADRFAGMAPPPAPGQAPAGPPPGLGAPPTLAASGQPQPVGGQPPAGVPGLGAPPIPGMPTGGAPSGMPAALGRPPV